MNKTFIRSKTQQGNKSQILTNKNATFPAHERITKTVSNYEEHIFEPIVEIISGSQDLTTVSASTDATLDVPNHVNYPKEYKSSRKNNLGASDIATSAKEKYVFVFMNNVAPATSPDGPLRIVDIKSAVSGDRYPLGNVTVKNVTFSADKVRSTISEVIENLPDKQNIDLNSTEVNHEYLLVLNSSIPFNINDVPAESAISLPTRQSSSNKQLYESTRLVSKCGDRKDTLNHPEQPVLTLVDNNDPFKTRGRSAAPEALVGKCKERLTDHYLTDDEIEEETVTSLRTSLKDISEEDDIYILVVNDDCENSETIKYSDQSDDDDDREQLKELFDRSENKGGIILNNIKRVNLKGCKKQYFCKRCEKSFNSMKCLRQHSMRKCCMNRNKTNAKRQQEARGMGRGRRSKILKQDRVDDKEKRPHEGTDSDERYVACAKCKGVFKNRKMLKLHILTSCNKVKMADRKRKMCEICGKVYIKTSQFQAHLDAHENLRQFKCSECSSRFNSRWFLTRHIAQVHRKCRLYMYFCSYCGLKSESKEHIQMHEQVHTVPEGAEVPRPYECFCGKSYISKFALRCHKNSSLSHGHVQKEMVLQCPLCNDELASAPNLNLHLEAKHNVNPTRGESAINCDQCDKRFTWFGSYVRHKLIKHKAGVMASEVEPYVGGRPASASVRVRQYKPRPRSQVRSQMDPQVCDVCDKECKSKRALYAHKWYHHNENRKIKLLMESTVPVLCDLCDKTLPNRYALSKHNFRYHRPREPSQLSCRICHKVFNNYGGLWSHNKYVHIKTLPYDCVVCGSKFKRKGDQTRHLKDKHGIVKPEDTAKEEYEAEAVPDGSVSDLGSCQFESMSYTQL